MRMTCSLLPYNYGNLTLPFSRDFWVILHVLIIKITLMFCQIITLNSHFGSFTPFNTCMRIPLITHVP